MCRWKLLDDFSPDQISLFVVDKTQPFLKLLSFDVFEFGAFFLFQIDPDWRLF